MAQVHLVLMQTVLEMALGVVMEMGGREKEALVEEMVMEEEMAMGMEMAMDPLVGLEA